MSRQRAQNGAVILLIGIGLALFVVPDGWQVPVVVTAGILEFFETAGTWRWSRRGKAKAGPETLVGGSGRAITEVRPEGMVRVRGEDWRARSEKGVDAGHPIRVIGRDQLTLLVEPVE
jgi:membrane-bound serine protease (ClpP class)